VWIVGDVQGYLALLERVLRDVGLIAADGSWTGGSATLVVLGDLVDRGPYGVGVIELIMRLQAEAPRHGGRVEVVIGNHDIQLLAAHRFGAQAVDAWRLAGGVQTDLERLTDVHLGWLQSLPAMILEREVLMVHADAMFYMDYGSTLDSVNDSFRAILDGNDVDQWERLLDRFGEHRAFYQANGCTNLDRFLATFGGSRLVHGHTPIARMLSQPPHTVGAPYVYCGGRCVNVDPGFYLGGPGFALNLEG
jgi:hypothetical protein